MKNKAKIKVQFLMTSGGDYQALYINGKKIEENHSLDPVAVAEAIAKAASNIEVSSEEVPDEQMETYGWSFPEEI
jgi:hypothetical protein